jgi:hypothetical protein
MAFLDQEIEQICNSFWMTLEDAMHSYPRNLETILWTQKLSLIALSQLNIAQVQDWLNSKHVIVPKSVKGQARRIFGCLVAYGGRGFIFVDKDASVVEKRFTIAHELGHFLRDYLKPRNDVINKLGKDIVDVLDGQRQATEDERIYAVLSSVRLNVYTDLLLRGENNQFVNSHVNISEVKADCIALELLAPFKSVLQISNVPPNTFTSEEIVARTFPILKDYFELPLQMANSYSQRLSLYFKKGQSIRDWLGF